MLSLEDVHLKELGLNPCDSDRSLRNGRLQDQFVRDTGYGPSASQIHRSLEEQGINKDDW